MWRLFLNYLMDRTQPPPETVVSVRISPRRVRVALVVFVSAFILMLCLVYGLVQWFLPQTFLELKERSKETRRELRVLRKEYENVQQDIVNVRMGSAVDRQSVEILRKELRDLQQELVDLREQNALYKGMIAPADLERGLVIRHWRVVPTESSNHYTFHLTLQQLTSKPALLDGVLNITLLGTQAGVPAKLQMKNLLSEQDAALLKFRFKYYLNLTASFAVPEGFEPKEWMISAGSRKPRQETDKSFPWLVESPEVSGGAEDLPQGEMEPSDVLQ